jgi:signal peptidase I
MGTIGRLTLYVQTQGPSMLPTLNELGDLVIVDRLSTRWNPITRNDIITAGSPSRETDYRVCKRVIGLPGDEVWMPGKTQPVVVRVQSNRKYCL